ncbi:MAG: hypothetical protein ACOCV1_03895 [Bacillota bacterium]
MKYKQFEDQINLPIFMDRPEEIQYSVDSTYGIEGREPKENLLHDFFSVQRDAILDSLDTHKIPILGNSFTIFYVKHVVVMYRRRDHEKTTFELLEDGNVLMRVKTHPKIDPEIKHDTKLIWTPGTLLYTFNHQLDGKYIKEINSNDARIRNLTKLTIKQSLINVLNRKTDKKIRVNGNDVLINGKKILGGEGFDFDKYYHEHGQIQTTPDHDLFNRYLKDDRNHIVSLENRGLQLPEINGSVEDKIHGSVIGSYSGIGAIEEEIPGYTKKQFSEDFVEEVNNFVKMLK